MEIPPHYGADLSFITDAVGTAQHITTLFTSVKRVEL